MIPSYPIVFIPTKMHQAVDGRGPTSSFKFLERTINQKCLAALLGVGSSRLKKGASAVPDLRCGKAKSESRQNTYSVDAFLTTLYDQLAETLPDRLLWPGNVLLVYLNQWSDVIL